MLISALIVDDEEFDRRLMHRALSADVRFGQVTVTESAESAQHHVSSLSSFAVVVTDIRMPWMDGLELISWLKASESAQHLPAVAMSSSNAAKDRVNAFAAGASSFITKPSSKEEKQAMVSKIAAVTFAHYDMIDGLRAS